MVIRNNQSALQVWGTQVRNRGKLEKILEKLSSGYRINRAADDASGLGVSEKMRAQITGLERAKLNAKDALSLVNTTDGALVESHEILRRMKYLAVQAADGVYDGEDREMLQQELDECLSELDRISDSTRFNGICVLKGPDAALPEEKPPEVPAPEPDIMTEPPWDDPINARPSIVPPVPPPQKAAPTGAAAFEAVLGGIRIKSAGVFEIQDGFTGTIFVDGGLDVKLTQQTPGAAMSGVYVECGAGTDLFLEDLNLESDSDQSLIHFTGGDNSLHLAGTNRLSGMSNYQTAIVRVGSGTDLVVAEAMGETGSLSVEMATSDGAGIGSNADEAVGNITIAGGRIELDAGVLNIGAGIGSGSRGGSGGDIAILGGTIIATGDSNFGALIGSGMMASVGNITVAGGQIQSSVTNTAGAVIGSGLDGKCGDIRILAGDVQIRFSGEGAAIGTGCDGFAGKILIEGGDETNVEIEAIEGTTIDAAAIGSGAAYMDHGIVIEEICIRGGNVTVTGGGNKMLGALIGSGDLGDRPMNIGKISIEGGKTILETAAGTVGAALGGGNGIGGGNIDISGGLLDITTAPGSLGAAIGGGGSIIGTPGDGGNVTISGGQVTVNGVVGGGVSKNSGVQGAGGTLTLTGGVFEGTSQSGITGINGAGAKRVTVSCAAPEWELSPAKTVNVLTNSGTFVSRPSPDGSLTLYLNISGPDPLEVELHVGNRIFKGVVTENPDGTAVLEVEYAGELENPEEPDVPEEPDDEEEEDNGIYQQPGVLVFQIGAERNDILQFRMRNMSTSALGVDSLRFTSVSEAGVSLAQIDRAIGLVSDYRGYCGAVQNRLEHTLSNLDTTIENITQAESRIRDMDMARGMMDFVRTDILSQASIAMLSQANALPQQVLELLR